MTVLRSIFDVVEAALCLLDEEAKEVAELVENISAIIPTAMSIINENSRKISGGGPRVSYYRLSDGEARGQNDHLLHYKFEKGLARIGGEQLTFDESAAVRKCLERLGRRVPQRQKPCFLFVDIITGLQT
jgi:hypothetical protein